MKYTYSFIKHCSAKAHIRETCLGLRSRPLFLDTDSRRADRRVDRNFSYSGLLILSQVRTTRRRSSSARASKPSLPSRVAADGCDGHSSIARAKIDAIDGLLNKTWRLTSTSPRELPQCSAMPRIK